jgi:hypothetical protein
MGTSQHPAADRPGGEPARNPLLHLTACLAITVMGALVTLAIVLLT